MRKLSISSLFLFIVFLIKAQPSTEVYLFDLQLKDGKYSLENPINISNNPGKYDNQPSFLPDGKSILFVSTRNEQTDVARYDIETGKKTFLTESNGGEYSPLKIPKEDAFSTIILKKNGNQLLCRYPLKGGEPKVVVPELVIGYHVWYDSKTLLAFVLGEKSTLQRIDVRKSKAEIIQSDIGRGLYKIPGSKKICFVDKTGEWTLKSYDIKSKKIETIVKALEGSEDFVLTNDGNIIMGKDDVLYQFKTGGKWEVMTSVKPHELSGITRLAISPDGKKIALVVNE